MKRLISVFIIAMLILTVAACGGDDASEAGAAAQPAEGANNNVVGRNVSILTPYLSSVTTNQMVLTMRAGMEAEGMVVTVVDTDGDFAQLASRIEDTVTAGADAIVIVSVDPGQIATALQTAFDNDIPVFGCDSGFIEGMQINATSDNYAMGALIARYLFEDLMGGEGTVIALTHRPHPGVLRRCEAFDNLLEEFPGITLITEQHVDVPGPIENSRQIMENLILSNSEPGSITAVWAAWDEPAIGATQALEAANRTEVVVTGVDGNSQAIEMIEAGGPLRATVSQNFDGMAAIVIEEMIRLFEGGTIERGDRYAPATLITG